MPVKLEWEPERFYTKSEKRNVASNLSSLQDEVNQFIGGENSSPEEASKKKADFLDYVTNKASRGEFTIEESQALQKIDLSKAIKQPNPIKPQSVEVPYAKSVYAGGSRDIALRDAIQKTEEDTAKTQIALEAMNSPSGKKLQSLKKQLSLRESIEKDRQREEFLAESVKSGDYETFKRSLPINRNADGEVTIRFTPSVLKMAQTPEGEQALRRAQLDFISEQKAGEDLRNKLEDEITKAENNRPKEKSGWGNDYLSKLGLGKKTEPTKVAVPETGETIDVGEKPPAMPSFNSPQEADKSGLPAGTIVLVGRRRYQI